MSHLLLSFTQYTIFMCAYNLCRYILYILLYCNVMYILCSCKRNLGPFSIIVVVVLALTSILIYYYAAHFKATPVYIRNYDCSFTHINNNNNNGITDSSLLQFRNDTVNSQIYNGNTTGQYIGNKRYFNTDSNRYTPMYGSDKEYASTWYISAMNDNEGGYIVSNSQNIADIWLPLYITSQHRIESAVANIQNNVKINARVRWYIQVANLRNSGNIFYMYLPRGQTIFTDNGMMDFVLSEPCYLGLRNNTIVCDSVVPTQCSRWTIE